jgi:hypothetical protein
MVCNRFAVFYRPLLRDNAPNTLPSGSGVGEPTQPSYLSRDRRLTLIYNLRRSAVHGRRDDHTISAGEKALCPKNSGSLK